MIFMLLNKPEVNIGEVLLILRYLVAEKYCDHDFDRNRYSITYRGKVLIEGGGFSTQALLDASAIQQEIDQRKRVEDLQISVRDWGRRAVIAAWFAGLMALAFLLWEVLKFFWLEPARALAYSSKGLIKIVSYILLG
jgi:hypothetical protein